MAKRHEFRPGDWQSAALRLDEIISAHTGEDPFEEALKLTVAKLAHEVTVGASARFLEHCGEDQARPEIDRLIGVAGDRWRGIVDAGARTGLSGPELLRCAAVLGSVQLLNDNLVGLDAIFEFIVNKASKGQKGQYFTPRYVISELVGIVAPRPGERVVDPACGSAGFLRQALATSPESSVWGFDHDARAVRVARAMLAASGQPASRIMRADSLRRPERVLSPGGTPIIEDLMRTQDATFTGFDVVLTNPPFAGDVGDEYSESYELGRGRRVERDVLFVERCLELLRPGGRFAIVLPHNKVGGESHAFMRSWLLERARIAAVVGLGRNTFMPHTSQKACVLIGVKRAEPTRDFRDESVQFFISERDGKDHRGNLTLAGDGSGIDHDLAEATTELRRHLAACCAS